jgi:hypothetical protein
MRFLAVKCTRGVKYSKSITDGVQKKSIKERKAQCKKLDTYLPVNRYHINDCYDIQCKCVQHCPYEAEGNIDCKKHSRWSKVTTMLVGTCAKQNNVLQCLCSCICLATLNQKASSISKGFNLQICFW